MDFEQRKSEARSMLVDFFAGFSAPRGLDEDQQAARISGIADAFARRMPIEGDYREKVESVFAKVRDTHLSNSWPPQAVFVMAMPKSETMGRKAQETFVPDTMKALGRKVEFGDGIPDRFIWGPGYSALLDSGFVSIDQLEKYRIASIRSFKETYRHLGYEEMFKRFGHEVTPYFDPRERVMREDIGHE